MYLLGYDKNINKIEEYLMAELAYMIFADQQGSVGGDAQKGVVVTNPKTILRPFSIPGYLSFSVVFSITDIDLSVTDHSFNFELKDEKGNIVSSMKSDTLKMMPDDNAKKIKVPSKFLGFNLGVTLENTVFQLEGIHKATVEFDGDLIGTKEIYVIAENTN